MATVIEVQCYTVGYLGMRANWLVFGWSIGVIVLIGLLALYLVRRRLIPPSAQTKEQDDSKN